MSLVNDVDRPAQAVHLWRRHVIMLDDDYIHNLISRRILYDNPPTFTTVLL